MKRLLNIYGILGITQKLKNQAKNASVLTYVWENIRLMINRKR